MTRSRHARLRLLGAALVATSVALLAPLPAAAAPATQPPQSYVVFDAGTGKVIESKDPHVPHLTASTIKVLTALVALEHLPMSVAVHVSALAASRPAAKIDMKEGSDWPMDQTLDSLMMVSANDAAYALAETTGGSLDGFATMVTASARRLGLRDTDFHDPAGLDGKDGYGGGTTSSAYDLAIVARNALTVPEIAGPASKETLGVHRPERRGPPAGEPQPRLPHDLSGRDRVEDRVHHRGEPHPDRGRDARRADVRVGRDGHLGRHRVGRIAARRLLRRHGRAGGRRAAAARPDHHRRRPARGARRTPPHARRDHRERSGTRGRDHDGRGTGSRAHGRCGHGGREPHGGGHRDGGAGTVDVLDGGVSWGSVLRTAGLVLLGLLVILVLLRRRAVKRRRARRRAWQRAHAEARRRGMIDVIETEDSEVRLMPTRTATNHHVAATGRRHPPDRRVVRPTRPRHADQERNR